MKEGKWFTFWAMNIADVNENDKLRHEYFIKSLTSGVHKKILWIYVQLFFNFH